LGAATIARVSDFGDPATERARVGTDALLCPLLDWDAIAITGPDAEAFLQAQLTNDVAALRAGDAQWNAWCSPKGRVLASFPLARSGDEAFLLIVPATLSPGFVRRLRLYVLRSKVVVTSLAGTHVVIGLDAHAARLADPELAVACPDGRRALVVSRDAATDTWQRLLRDAAPAGSPAWDLLGIRAGVAVITPATEDRFVPQMLNWELVGGVSFRKGCYPGQEIVARMQYRGRVKERLYRARIAAGAVPGASLFGRQFGEQACGTVVNAVHVPGSGTELLAVLQTASAESDRISLTPGSEEALTLLDLPYAVPAASQPATG
jgi:folate-binding protein YgfZ